MSEEQDRGARLSDLNALEERVASKSDLKALEERVAWKSDVNALEQRLVALERRVKREGKKLRRYFDVVAERIESHVKLIAEGHSHQAKVLDDHESLQQVEKRV